MANSENRRFFRFPAILDNEPVKVSQEERILFQEDGTLDQQANKVQTNLAAKNPDTNNQTNHHEEATIAPSKSRPKPTYRKQSANFERPQTKEPVLGERYVHLKKTKENLTEQPIKKAASSKQAAVSPVKPEATTKSETNFYQERRYFKPKYIPSSPVPQKVEEATSLARIGTALKERKTNYLLIDHDEHFAPFHVKERESEPTIRKYRAQESDIPVTRKQYKRLKTDAGFLPDQSLGERLPKTRKEIQHAKKVAKESAVFLKKQEQETPKKKSRPNSRLEKTLSGIMEDEENKQGYNRYFEEPHDQL